MAVELVSETFTRRVGEAFEVFPAEGEAFELVLSRCEAAGFGSPDQLREQFGREPFSLIFHAAERDRYWPQQTFRLRHAELGELELFLVPLGPDERGMQYQAVIS